jgi:hypothetical protein
MSDNPYAAPQAQVIEVEGSGGDPGFQTDPVVCPAGHGFKWIADGWALFTLSPGVWIGMVLIWWMMILVIGLIPFIGGLITNLLNWALIAGMMYGCDKLRRGVPMSIGDLFHGLNTRFQPLAIIGCLYLGGYLAALVITLVVVFAIGGASLWAQGGNFEQLLRDPMPLIMVALIGVLVLMGLIVPILMAIWFTPALIIFHDLEPIEACKLSFRGCLKNWLPYLVYGIGLLLIMLVLIVPIGVLIALKGVDFGAIGVGLLMVLAIVMGILSMPITMSSTYASYRDIYYRA